MMALFWFLLTLTGLLIVERWIHRHLHGVALLLTNHDDMALILYALVLLPGVALHEISHALMATILRVRSANLTIIPRREPEGYVRLGSVQVEQVDTIRMSLIGLAPLLFGSLAILLIIQYAFGVSGLGDAIRTHDPSTMFAALSGALRVPDAWLWLYLLFAISNAMLPSSSDREPWLPVIVFIVLVIVVALLAGLGSTLSRLGPAIDDGLAWLAAAFTITLIVDLPFVFVIWLVERTVGGLRGQHVYYDAPPEDLPSQRRKK
jgi:hypothetical protein